MIIFRFAKTYDLHQDFIKTYQTVIIHKKGMIPSGRCK